MKYNQPASQATIALLGALCLHGWADDTARETAPVTDHARALLAAARQGGVKIREVNDLGNDAAFRMMKQDGTAPSTTTASNIGRTSCECSYQPQLG